MNGKDGGGEVAAPVHTPLSHLRLAALIPRGGRWVRLLLVCLAAAAALACAGGPPVAAPDAPGVAEASGGRSDARPLAPRSAEAERIARSATWSPGQLQAHFAKHGREGSYATAEAYDSGARETIRGGREFTYIDRTTHARRRGFYAISTNGFTGVTDDGKRITTHFRPESGEHYVRGLWESTYR